MTPKGSKDSDMRASLTGFFYLEDPLLEAEGLRSYGVYYWHTWQAIQSGDPPEADSMQAVSDRHIQAVTATIIQFITAGSSCQRQSLRESLSKEPLFQDHPEESLNRTIDLTLRLWLVLNVRDEEFSPGARSIQWDDSQPLHEFISSQFPQPRFLRELSEKMFDFALPDGFTMVKLKRYSGIKVDWTYDLSEHLELDRDHRILKVFPLKYYLNGLRRSKVEIIPHAVIDEYIKTMNLLFPSWDMKTQKFLKKRHQTFAMEAPVDYPGALFISDFHYWRDRISVLFTEFSSPPPSMTQLYHDRRNILQWYTFWFAVVIAGLTVVFGVISSVTACLSTRYAYEALLLAREAAATANLCSSTPLPTPA